MPELPIDEISDVGLYVDALEDIADTLGIDDLSFSVYAASHL